MAMALTDPKEAAMPMQSIASPPGVPSSIDVRPGITVMWACGPRDQWRQVRLVRQCPNSDECWVVRVIGQRGPRQDEDRRVPVSHLRTACPICGTFAHGNIEDPNELRRCNDEVASTEFQEARAEWWERQQ